MILVLGGLASGKRTYVRSLGYGHASMSPRVGEAPVLLDLHEALRDGPAGGLGATPAPGTPGGLAGLPEDALLDALCAHDVVVCAEVGCGLVPATPEERAWRERVGRTCAALAARATSVVRLVCGVPQVLAGPVPAPATVPAPASAFTPPSPAPGQ